jgi:hypothetical protein
VHSGHVGLTSPSHEHSTRPGLRPARGPRRILCAGFPFTGRPRPNASRVAASVAAAAATATTHAAPSNSRTSRRDKTPLVCSPSSDREWTRSKRRTSVPVSRPPPRPLTRCSPAPPARYVCSASGHQSHKPALGRHPRPQAGGVRSRCEPLAELVRVPRRCPSELLEAGQPARQSDGVKAGVSRELALTDRELERCAPGAGSASSRPRSLRLERVLGPPSGLSRPHHALRRAPRDHSEGPGSRGGYVTLSRTRAA